MRRAPLLLLGLALLPVFGWACLDAARFDPDHQILDVPSVQVGDARYGATLARVGGGGHWLFRVTELVPVAAESVAVYDAAARRLVLPRVAGVGEDCFEVRMALVPAPPDQPPHLVVTEARRDGIAFYRLLAVDDGALWLPSPESFRRLAQTTAAGGVSGSAEVKFVIADADGDAPLLTFQNSRRYAWHFDFVRDALGWYPDLPRDRAEARFLATTYFSPARRQLAGSVVYYPHADCYALEFWPTDPVPVAHVVSAWRLIRGAMPFAADRLIYHPVGQTQARIAREQALVLANAGVPVIFSQDLFRHVRESVLNPGEAFGRLRRIAPGDPPPGPEDIAIFTYVPNRLGRVAGIITTTPQTTLSHINLRAKQDRRPNAYVADAADRADIAPLIGGWVHFRAGPEGVALTPVSQAEAEAWLAALRPTEPQVPEADLSVTGPMPLAAIGFNDWTAFGVKAANVAELGKILPEGVAPDGYAIPFALYDRYMALPRCGPKGRSLCPPGESGPSFYDQAEAALTESDTDRRRERLAALRKDIRKGESPADMIAALEAIRRFWDPDGPPFRRSLRCRSSTNNEDLPGFNGAGLYRSTTHHPDEGPLIESVKKVWASLWNDVAVEERVFWRVDHFRTYMGVLVHPNYGDEQANGVAVSKNLYNPDWPGITVNVQHGEISVTNPEPLADGTMPVPDEFVLVRLPGADSPDTWETLYLRHTDVTEVYGKSVAPGLVLREEEIEQLRHFMTLIHHHFKKRYRGGDDFAIEVEFKITATDDGSRGRLAIKQARVWVE